MKTFKAFAKVSTTTFANPTCVLVKRMPRSLTRKQRCLILPRTTTRLYYCILYFRTQSHNDSDTVGNPRVFFC